MAASQAAAISGNFCSLGGASRKDRSLALNSRSIVFIPQHLYGLRREQLPGGQRSRSIRASRCFLMDVVVRSGVDPSSAGPLSPNSSPGSWKWWIVGVVISVVLPFWKSKWGPLLTLKNKVDTVVETAEELTKVVEKVAEVVEKVAEDVVEILPEGGKLRNAAEVVEHVANETAKDAHLVEGFIDKAEELEKTVEEGMENLIEPVKDRPVAAVGDVAAAANKADEGNEPAGSV